MPATDLPFSATEYARRLGLVRAEMARRNLDALFVEDPSNMAWLTGYDGWSFYVHQGVIVTHDRDPVWWGRRQDAQRRAPHGLDGRPTTSPAMPTTIVQSTVRHPMQDLARALRDLGYGEGADRRRDGQLLFLGQGLSSR